MSLKIVVLAKQVPDTRNVGNLFCQYNDFQTHVINY